MKVALVHDWLTGTRGGEKVLLDLVRLFPDATLFTLFHFPGSVPAGIERLPIRTTFLQSLVSPRRDYRKLLPAFPLAAETWNLEGFDLVVSSSHCVAKNARRGHGAFHVDYCHTPVRYLHDQFDDYFGGRPGIVPLAARALRGPLRRWDVATVPRVDAFVANSRNVEERIRRLYSRAARVVAPPVDTDFYTPAREPSARSGLLVVSALAPYKRVADAVEAANRSREGLSIAGSGPEESRLRALAGPTVRFLGSPSDAELRQLYREAEAVLMPGEEDFGIVPLEAQACGAPVVALGRGGALETVVDGETGIHYPETGPAALLDALARLRTLRPDPARMRSQAVRFSRPRFRAEVLEAFADAAASSGRGQIAASLRRIPSSEESAS